MVGRERVVGENYEILIFIICFICFDYYFLGSFRNFIEIDYFLVLVYLGDIFNYICKVSIYFVIVSLGLDIIVFFDF